MTDASRAEMIGRLKEHSIEGSRVERALKWELRSWSLEELDVLLHRLKPLESRLGSRYPCGPRYNRLSSVSASLTLTIASILSRVLVVSLLSPFQLCAALYLGFKWRWKAILTEIPQLTIQVSHWFATIPDPLIKAPLRLVRESIDERKALCVNRQGKFKLISDGYTVMSHVWGETMAWQSTTGWGPLTLNLRKKGMSLDHLERCIDQCETEWLWLDQIAMPEVFEDMDSAQKSQTERLRIDIINNLHSIYSRADKVVIVDSALICLNTASLIDAAVVFSLGFWMIRLWPLIECRLARKVFLKTEDQFFDLDVIIDYLARSINNDQHRYYPLLCRLMPLRATPAWSERFISYGDQDDDISRLFQDLNHACETRFTAVGDDIAKVLFPLFDLKWQYEWTLEDGLRHVEASFPNQQQLVCQYSDDMKRHVSL